MIKKIIILLFVFSFIHISYGKLNYLSKGKWRINTDFNYNTSSSIFNLNSDEKIFGRDTFNIIIPDSIAYRYILKHSFELKEYIFSPKLEYAISNNFLVFLEIPLIWQSMSNVYENDTNRNSPTFGRQVTRAEYSTFYPDYYGLGGSFEFGKGILSSSFLFGMKVPATLENGYQQDTTNNFYIYNAYQFYLGLISGMNFEKGFLELETSYLYRSGDFGNLFHIKFEGGFTSVPNTALKGIVIYNINLSDFDGAQPVNPRFTTMREDVLDVGAAFEANVSDNVQLEFSYLITLGLTNTLKYGNLILKTSIVL